MPLYPQAVQLIRTQFEEMQKGNKPPAVVIGTLTDQQLAIINAERKAENLPLIISEVLFVGRHAYTSRILGDHYTIDDVIDQIQSAMDDSSEVFADDPTRTAMQNPHRRADRYGNMVNDRAVFECTRKHPRAELYSVVPKGDAIKPAEFWENKKGRT